ncbi:MAG: VCBS repeat-containing protein [Saprospiraceae bacterium]|nr:VCBS repeat-containing protein [Saprospiraceae bacterium]
MYRRMENSVTVVDINRDGWLDLYVCRSAMSDTSLRKNLLFINNQDLTFSEQEQKTVGDMGYSTQAAFLITTEMVMRMLLLSIISLPEYSKFLTSRSTLLLKEIIFHHGCIKTRMGILKCI